MAKRTNTSKDEEVKNKVSNLLKDVFPKKVVEKEVDVLDKVSENKGLEWLQEDIDRLTLLNEELTQENEQLKSDLQKAMVDMNKLRNSPNAPVDVEQIKNSVRSLFTDLENAYLGRNPERRQYPDAKIKIILDKMLGFFPFLMKK